MSRYIVTGARGFVGRAFMARFPHAEALPMSGEENVGSFSSERAKA